MENTLENNSVLIAGKIVHECEFSHDVYGEGFYIFEIASERLSNYMDILPITISERLIDKEQLKVGVTVSIQGQLRSYNNYYNNFMKKRNRLILTVFAREIEIISPEEHDNPNQIYLNGFICKPPVYRQTPFGREIADLLLAVNRAYNKSDYIPCIAWGRNARYTQKLQVGSNIHIWGRIQSRQYQKRIDDMVEEKTAYEVSISKMEHVQEEDD